MHAALPFPTIIWDDTEEGIPILEGKRAITVVTLWLLWYLRQLPHFTPVNRCSYSSCKIRSRDKSSPEDTDEIYSYNLIAPGLSLFLSTFIPKVFKARLVEGHGQLDMVEDVPTHSRKLELDYL